jgi:hypothetical protein
MFSRAGLLKTASLLKDEELNQVTGGAGAGTFVKLGEIKGESTDKDHKDW